jgi:hypothetical protein
VGGVSKLAIAAAAAATSNDSSKHHQLLLIPSEYNNEYSKTSIFSFLAIFALALALAPRSLTLHLSQATITHI